ncbi:MAG: hypothetical protein WKG07_08260 [Hymenobacter sp.]
MLKPNSLLRLKTSGAKRLSLMGGWTWCLGKDLLNAATILPELKDEAIDLIGRRLGYLPLDELATIKYEPFLRVLIKQYQNRQLKEEAFASQAEDLIKMVRQSDMRHEPFIIAYEPRHYALYETQQADYKSIVRNRISRFLGYAPDLRYSLNAELWLRHMMTRSLLWEIEDETDFDRRAITVIKYRELLLADGLDAADCHALLGTESAVSGL